MESTACGVWTILKNSIEGQQLGSWLGVFPSPHSPPSPLRMLPQEAQTTDLVTGLLSFLGSHRVLSVGHLQDMGPPLSCPWPIRTPAFRTASDWPPAWLKVSSFKAAFSILLPLLLHPPGPSARASLLFLALGYCTNPVISHPPPYMPISPSTHYLNLGVPSLAC